MSGYLYFPNILKDIEDHIQAYMIHYKKFFQLMVTDFKEDLNLQLILIFYSSIRFVLETEFTSEQIAENRFGAMLEISNKFIIKFIVLSCMVLQFRLNSLENFKTILYGFKNSGQVVPRKLGMKLLEMRKDMNINHSVSSPSYKVWRNFFCKKCLQGGSDD